VLAHRFLDVQAIDADAGARAEAVAPARLVDLTALELLVGPPAWALGEKTAAMAVLRTQVALPG
jgi:hypothetical protein